MSQESKLDTALIQAEKFSSLFKIQNYFDFIKKTESIVAVPFYVTATIKDLNTQCDHLFRGKAVGDIQTYYCNEENYIAQYAATGQKLLRCIGCPLHTITQ